MEPIRKRLISALEELTDLLENHSDSVERTPLVSSQQLVGEVSSFLWHLRRDTIRRLWTLAILFKDSGVLHQLAINNDWESQFISFRAIVDEAVPQLNRIHYYCSQEAVELGDHIIYKSFFRRKTGRVVYLPGVSKRLSQIDYGGLFSIGIHTSYGGFTAMSIDPDSLQLRRSVSLIRRDGQNIPSHPTDSELEKY